MIEQILLSAARCSNRGVRYKTLTPAQVDAINVAAASDCTADTTLIELRMRQMQLGAEAMVTEVTKVDGIKTTDELLTAEWVKVDAETLSRDWAKWFKAKDTAVLRRIYELNHIAFDADVDAIMGKALAVSSD